VPINTVEQTVDVQELQQATTNQYSYSYNKPTTAATATSSNGFNNTNGSSYSYSNKQQQGESVKLDRTHHPFYHSPASSR
jgi:hypothetical protein